MALATCMPGIACAAPIEALQGGVRDRIGLRSIARRGASYPDLDFRRKRNARRENDAVRMCSGIVPIGARWRTISVETHCRRVRSVYELRQHIDGRAARATDTPPRLRKAECGHARHHPGARRGEVRAEEAATSPGTAAGSCG
ncbi:hypothetical protein [Xanthomonas sp. LMG 12461]|uniref:hypothetical protein n=1 Tax=Xanthomonas sp. LMG 12461 TaxID=2014543 RepID=UPI00186B456C|nr:hypothetical protein [Xanthomonas sp. LMG 12461]